MALFHLVSAKDFIPRAFELFQKGRGAGYTWASFGKDCVAGLTVGVVALPLAMAFSIAAGGTPAQGLYTAITAGFFISLLGGSRYQIGGPTGAFVVIIFGIIARHQMPGLILATIMAGVMLIVMGLTGLGRFIRFIPYPVTTGFTTGIGVLIFTQQIKNFFGLNAASPPEFLEMWRSYLSAAKTVQPLTLALGLGTLAAIIVIRRFAPRIPAAVVGVIAASLVCYFFSLNTETIGAIPRTLPSPGKVFADFPPITWSLIRQLLPDSFAIALLAAIESLLSAVVADGMSGDRHNANMELVAQGVGNIASAIFGGIPATGAIARTAANIKSNAVSPVAGIVHAITLLLFIMFLAPLAQAIPLVSLSAVLMVISWDMSNIPRFVRILTKAPKSDAFVLLTTFVLTVMIDLTFAVEVGVVLAAFLFLRRMIEVAEIKPGAKGIGSEIVYGHPEEAAAPGRVAAAVHAKNIEVYEITGPFFFGVADTLQRTLRGLARKPHAFVLRMRDVPAVDSTGIAALESFLAQCRHGKIRLLLCEVREHPFAALKKAGFIDELGADNVAPSLEDAFKQAEEAGN